MFKITNMNEQGSPAFNFVGRFDGVDYSFPSPSLVHGKQKLQPVYCDDEAVRHIFGIGDPVKSPYLARHGWAQVTGTVEQGMAILNKFVFEHVTQELDAPLAVVTRGKKHDPSKHDPALVSQGAGANAADDARAPAVAG